MTVDRNTGEIVEPLSEQEAERLTTRIALKLDAMADTYAGVMPMIREAIDREAWRALEYRSVTEYVADRFGGALGKLGMEIRREVVKELTAAGMSTRAIAPVVGVSDRQVRRDVSGGTHVPPDAHPEPRTITGLDGKAYTRPERTATPPSPEAEERLADFIESDTSIQDQRYMLALLKSLQAAAGVHQFDPERVAQIADTDEIAAIDAAFENFAGWRKQVNNRRSGLRIVKGDTQ